MSRIGLLVKKVGCTSIFDEEFSAYRAATLLHLEDSCILSMEESDDDTSVVRVGYGNISPRKLNKPQRDLYSKINISPRRKMMEFRVKSSADLKVAQSLAVDHFQIGQYVDAVAKSIGKGFAGVIKRHNFKGLSASHGVSISHRSHGSTGQCQDPGRVFKGKKMAGRMGGKRVTIQNLRILDIDAEKSLIVVYGSVPGPKNGYVLLKDAIKKGMY